MRIVLVRWLEGQGFPTWVPDYRFMLTAAIVSGCLLTLFVCRRRGLRLDTVQDLLFWGVLSLLLGAKALHWLQFGWGNHTWWEFLHHGFSLYGGFFGLSAAWLILHQIHPFPLGRFLDCATPGLAFGLALGRVGCFLAGCDGGRPCSLGWCVGFPPDGDAFAFQVSREMIGPSAKFSLPAHPTQLYEVVFAVTVLIAALLRLKRDPAPGSVFLTAVMSYAAYRFLTEPIRVDLGGLHPFGLTFASFLSLVVLAVGAGVWGRYLSRQTTDGRRSG